MSNHKPFTRVANCYWTCYFCSFETESLNEIILHLNLTHDVYNPFNSLGGLYGKLHKNIKSNR